MSASLPAWLLWLAALSDGGVVTVGPGAVRPPLAPPGAEAVAVGAFRMDAVPVTRARFQAFMRAHPRWRRDRIGALLADAGYLEDWEAPDRAGGPPEAPVTRVSWYAARAYCAARGARLPTEAEHELAAAAPEPTSAATPGVWARQALGFGKRPGGELRPVARGPANRWGLFDLDGALSEWVEDFNAAIIGGDAESGRVCGGPELGAAGPGELAAWQRLSFRSTLTARTTRAGLGFRCAADVEAR